jgi:hypothetical protein
MKANGYTDIRVMLTDDRRWGDSLKAPHCDRRSRNGRWLTRSPTTRRTTRRSSSSSRETGRSSGRVLDTRRPAAEDRRKNSDRHGRATSCIPPIRSRAHRRKSVRRDVISARRSPCPASDYKVTFTPDEMTRAEQVLPPAVRLVEAWRGTARCRTMEVLPATTGSTARARLKAHRQPRADT